MNEHLPGSDDDWQPNEEAVEWAKQFFAQIGVGGVWSPEGSGVTYVRQDESTFALVRMLDHPTAKSHHARFKKLFDAVSVELLDGDGVVLVPHAMSAQENLEQEFEHKREITQSWRCECELPLAEFDLAKRIDEFIEEKDVLLSNGDTTPVQIWGCCIICPSCEKEVRMDPDDFQLLAGDDLFMRWRDREDGIYKALTRMEICDLTDAGIMGVALGSKLTGTDERVPPWMWGTYCIYRPEVLQDESED